MYKEYSEEFINELAEKINILDYISQYIELKQKGKNYFSICPFHKEDTSSFSVTPDKGIWYCFGCHKGGNIITFAMEYHNLSYPDAVEYLSNYVGVRSEEIKQQSETIKFLKQFNKKTKIEPITHKILPKNIMDKYSNEPILEWIWEGISEDVMDKYQVRYDKVSNRAVFPIWDNDGNIINVKGRTLYEDYKSLGLSKYIYYYTLGGNDFLYPLHKKREIIKEKNEIILVEGEKSVLKLDGYGILNSVALCTSHINDHQIEIILGLKANVVVALDKGIPLEKIKEQCSQLIKFTNVFIIYDIEGKLNEKNAPCDQGFTIWEYLYANKIKL